MSRRCSKIVRGDILAWDCAHKSIAWAELSFGDGPATVTRIGAQNLFPSKKIKSTTIAERAARTRRFLMAFPPVADATVVAVESQPKRNRLSKEVETQLLFHFADHVLVSADPKRKLGGVDRGMTYRERKKLAVRTVRSILGAATFGRLFATVPRKLWPDVSDAILGGFLAGYMLGWCE